MSVKLTLIRSVSMVCGDVVFVTLPKFRSAMKSTSSCVQSHVAVYPGLGALTPQIPSQSVKPYEEYTLPKAEEIQVWISYVYAYDR